MLDTNKQTTTELVAHESSDAWPRLVEQARDTIHRSIEKLQEAQRDWKERDNDTKVKECQKEIRDLKDHEAAHVFGSLSEDGHLFGICCFGEADNADDPTAWDVDGGKQMLRSFEAATGMHPAFVAVLQAGCVEAWFAFDDPLFLETFEELIAANDGVTTEDMSPFSKDYQLSQPTTLNPTTLEPLAGKYRLPDAAPVYNLAKEIKQQVVLTPAQWAERKVAPFEPLLGRVFGSTTSTLLSGPTGKGKTMFGVGLGAHMAVGHDFLGWHAYRPACVLYIDGEMPEELLKERITKQLEWLGATPETFFALRAEDVELPPLNTPDGQAKLARLIKQECGDKLDFVIFDSIMSLTTGSLKGSEAWASVLPLVKNLKARAIGQLWLHHTGYDTSHGYGDSTRTWQLDTEMLLEAIADKHDLAFALKFGAKQRRNTHTPEMEADYSTRKVKLAKGEWTCDRVAPAAKIDLTPTAKKFFNVLGALDADIVLSEVWSDACVTAKLLSTDGDKLAHSSRSLFSQYRKELVTKGWITVDGDGYVTINR
jgi:hypothetical protein